MTKKVWLDPGHGGSDPGASYGGLVEKKMVLVTAFETRRILQAHGVTVGMTRTTDVFVSIDKRPKLANNWGADLFVSIHYNAGGGDGAEVIHSIVKGTSEQLAKNIVNTIKSELKQNLRPKPTYSRKGSDGRDYHGVIRGSKMPSVIVEPGFVDSKDKSLFDTEAKQKKVGVAIAHGILKQLKITIKDVDAKKPVTSKPSTSTTGTYVVKSGDNLSKIAAAKKTTVAKLKSLNGLKSDLIKPGQKLKYPLVVTTKNTTKSKFTLYTVKSGDNLSKIAAKYKVSVAQIKKLSSLKSDLIKPKMVLRIK